MFFRKELVRDFPGSLVVKNPPYQCKGCGLDPWSGPDSLQPHGLYSPWNSPSQNTAVGSLSLLQGIFPSQGSNPGLPHCRRILYRLNHQKIYCVVWVLFTFWILNPYQTIICNYLLPFGGFLVSWWFPSVQKLLSLISSHLFIFPFSRGSSQPRDQTQVSDIAGGFFTSWATRDRKC